MRRSAANAFVESQAATAAFDLSVEHTEPNPKGEPEDRCKETCTE